MILIFKTLVFTRNTNLGSQGLAPRRQTAPEGLQGKRSVTPIGRQPRQAAQLNEVKMNIRPLPRVYRTVPTIP